MMNEDVVMGEEVPQGFEEALQSFQAVDDELEAILSGDPEAQFDLSWQLGQRTTGPLVDNAEVSWRKSSWSRVSPHVGTLVSEQGVKAAFRLGMDKEVRCNQTLAAVLWLYVSIRALRFTSLGREDST